MKTKTICKTKKETKYFCSVKMLGYVNAYDVTSHTLFNTNYISQPQMMQLTTADSTAATTVVLSHRRCS